MSTTAERRYQCRHIFTDGHRCGSPSLRGENFCYYHHTTRRPKPATPRHDAYNNPPNQTTFVRPTPEDASALQLSIGQIMNRLASNALDPRRAGLLLYALQIASTNLKTIPEHSASLIVRQVTHDPVEGPLAPKVELPGDRGYREFLKAWNLDEDDIREDEADDEDELDDDEEEDLEDEEEDLEEDEHFEDLEEDHNHNDPEDRDENNHNGGDLDRLEASKGDENGEQSDLQSTVNPSKNMTLPQKSTGHAPPAPAMANKSVLWKANALSERPPHEPRLAPAVSQRALHRLLLLGKQARHGAGA